MSDFKPIETQEELDRIIQDRLNRQKEKFSDYDEVKKRNAELESEIGALKNTIEESGNVAKTHEQTVAELNAKIAGYETSSLRTRIALQNGLPLDLADRLVGEDEASIKADAERLAAFMKPKTTVPPLRSQEPSLGDEKNQNWIQMAKNLGKEE